MEERDLKIILRDSDRENIMVYPPVREDNSRLEWWILVMTITVCLAAVAHFVNQAWEIVQKISRAG